MFDTSDKSTFYHESVTKDELISSKIFPFTGNYSFKQYIKDFQISYANKHKPPQITSIS